jgi:DNA-binding beta-propeller fold protein YncE
MKNLSRILLALIIINVVAFSACKKDTPSDSAIMGKQPFAEGVFIINEGMFPGIGSVSFYNRTTGKVQNDIYSEVNGVPLGSTVQSIEVYDSLAYIVVNNSGKVEVVNAGTFKSVGTLTGLNSPRYFIGIDSTKGYVSDWPNTVAVINLQDLSVTKTIETFSGPEKMVLSGDEVYVINGGGWGIDSTITVIDYHNDLATQTIQVGKRPTGIVKDADGRIWVMCSGKGFNGWPHDGDSEGHIMKINPVSHKIEKDIIFPGTANHPEKLAINKDGTILYFLYSQGIYQMNISSSTFNYTMLVESGDFYNLGCDPVSGLIYASDPGDFQSDGYVYRFNPTDGAMIDSLKVGIGPGEFCFR